MPNLIEIHTLAAMLKAYTLSVTSEVLHHEIENALDGNLDSWWEPTSTADQDVVIDMGSGGTIIGLSNDRYFSSAVNWANVDLATFDDISDLSITSNAVDQYCKLAAAGLMQKFKAGHSYRIHYDYNEISPGFAFRTETGEIGTAIAGTFQTIDFTVGAQADQTELWIEATSSSADGHFDNINILELDDRLTINGWSWFLYNNNVDHGADPSARLNVLYSHDQVLWVAFNTNLWSVWQPVTDRLVVMGSNIANAQYRFIKFSLINMATIVKVSGMVLRRLTTMGQGNEFPESDQVEFAMKMQQRPGAVTMKRLINSNPIYTRRRSWLLSEAAEKDKLEAIWRQSYGPNLPVILAEDNAVPEVMRLVNPPFSPAAIGHEMFRPQIILQTVPFADPVKGF